MDKKNIEEMYKVLKSVPKSKFDSGRPEKLAKTIEGMSNTESVAFYLSGKLAHTVESYQDFEMAILKNEYPAMKLSSTEMEFLKGGQDDIEPCVEYYEGSWRKILNTIADGLDWIASL